MGKAKNFKDMSAEERREVSAKGGRAKAAKDRAARDLNALALAMVDAEAVPQLARATRQLAPTLGEGVTNGAAMTAQVMRKALKGDVRAYETLRDMAESARAKEEAKAAKGFEADMAVLIGRDFVDAHRHVDEGAVRDQWHRGGRGSLKSSFISLEVARLLMRDEDANAVVLQASQSNIRDGTFAQMQWAFDRLGVADLWTPRPGTRRFVNEATGQLVLFRGCDDPRKLKSVKFSHGYCRAVWFEECDLFRGMGEIRSVLQTVARGDGGRCQRFYSFNPPRSADSWVNVECDRIKAAGDPTAEVVESCWTDAPPEWLGESFIRDAEGLKETDELAYRHEYLGEAVGVGGAVFPRAEFGPITDEQVRGFDKLYAGQDWGWWPDPWAFTLSAWEPSTRTLYTFAELGGNRLQPDQSAAMVIDALKWPDEEGAEPVYHDLPVLSDDADPGSIQAHRDAGVRAVAAGKGGKRMLSYQWLSSVRWVIDPERCPNLAHEVRAMTYEQAPDGTWLNRVPDGDDHWVDATRYALMPVAARRGAYGTEGVEPVEYVSPFARRREVR